MRTSQMLCQCDHMMEKPIWGSPSERRKYQWIIQECEEGRDWEITTIQTNDKAIQNLIFFASNSAILFPILLISAFNIAFCPHFFCTQLLSLVAMASATFSVAKPSLQVLFHFAFFLIILLPFKSYIIMIWYSICFYISGFLWLLRTSKLLCSSLRQEVFFRWVCFLRQLPDFCSEFLSSWFLLCYVSCVHLYEPSTCCYFSVL